MINLTIGNCNIKGKSGDYQLIVTGIVEKEDGTKKETVKERHYFANIPQCLNQVLHICSDDKEITETQELIKYFKWFRKNFEKFEQKLFDEGKIESPKLEQAKRKRTKKAGK